MAFDRCSDCPLKDLNTECQFRGFCSRDGVVLMTRQARVQLFLLSAFTTVLVPAVMMSVYRLLMVYDKKVVFGIGLVFLTTILFTAFLGLYASIFRSKTIKIRDALHISS